MSPSSTRCLTILLMAAAVIAPLSLRAQGQDVVRGVYLSAFDTSGVPVLDLAPGDLVVKENGRPREIVTAEPATAPMHIALLVDDNGTGMFRASVAMFVQRLIGEAKFSISAVTGQVLRLVDYTSEPRALVDAIGKLNARPATPEGGQLLEGIYEAARELQKREVERPVIVVLTVGGVEHSPMPASHVLNQLRDSRASLHVFSVTNNLLRSTGVIDRPSILLETAININGVLGDGPGQSGGRREEIVATTGIVQGLRELAEELAHQYHVTYRLPEGVKPSDKLGVTAVRRGISLRAPTRVPAR
jgi:hypothetical protein